MHHRLGTGASEKKVTSGCIPGVVSIVLPLRQGRSTGAPDKLAERKKGLKGEDEPPPRSFALLPNSLDL